MYMLPDYLKKNDKIAIVCPAKKLPKSIEFGIKVLESWGLKVILGETVNASHHQFAGDDVLRAQDIQQYLDDKEIKAIIAARGGYGTIRIIDELDFTNFKNNPKWIVGFSDITILLSHIYANFHIPTIHGQMPMTFDEATPASLESLRKILFGEFLEINAAPHQFNKIGSVEGEIIGGNLALLINIEGSVSEMNFDDKILFIEDVGEHEYAIDRMMRMLKRAGKLKKLKALIVGCFNELGEESIYFGQNPNEIIKEVVEEYNYPVCFDFPIGHIENNMAIIVGGISKLNITKEKVSLIQNF